MELHDIEAGLVAPTTEELARMKAELAEYEAWRERQDRLLAKARVALAGITDPVVRLVLDLHRERSDTTRPQCRECWDGADDAEPEDWPCDTVRTIAGHFGIHVDEPYPDDKQKRGSS
jgi:hypothetical protein